LPIYDPRLARRLGQQCGQFGRVGGFADLDHS
jgi:hypothetical protein